MAEKTKTKETRAEAPLASAAGAGSGEVAAAGGQRQVACQAVEPACPGKEGAWGSSPRLWLRSSMAAGACPAGLLAPALADRTHSHTG